ncbi:RNA-directed DNA polymerase [Candidatus Saccharibacteria bacterium]|nr:RNA-directed DNA polymerase [Candidatus Saccharibacteria bacterium]
MQNKFSSYRDPCIDLHCGKLIDPILEPTSKITPLDLDATSRDIASTGWHKWLKLALTDAFIEARKGKLGTHDEHDFELNWIENINRLAKSIDERTYAPGASVSFVIHDPMVREIFAAPFRDRIIHHFLFNMQYGWWDRRFINNSYSCRKNKGTLYGIKSAQKMMQSVTNNYKEEAYIIKLDISGYFMSLSRAKIYQRVKWGLDRQFETHKTDPHIYRLYKTCDFLWHQILFDDPVKKSWKRGDPANWSPSILPPNKSLYQQPAGRGIVIGNLTSQLVSNIYLDQLDRFIRYELGYKHYGRYVDDFFIMIKANDYHKAKKDVAKIEAFLKEHLDLILHKKKRYYSKVIQGMQFLGARIYPHCLYPSDRVQAHMYRAAERVANSLEAPDTILSYLGLLKHLNANHFLQKLFDNYGWDYRQ